MGKYGNIQYLVDRPEPSKLFLEARSIAGNQIQNEFNKFNQQVANSSYDGFKWIKAEFTSPSFDHLTFAYKNAIFSVLIVISDNTGDSYTKKQEKRFLDACNDNQLIPCLFRIKLTQKKKIAIFKKQDNEEYSLSPFKAEWNLVNALTNEDILPHKVTTETPVEMSKWELNNFAIQIVRDQLSKEGNTILSFCDVLEINPQIWFKDKQENICWVVVKHIVNDEDLDYRKWVGLEKSNQQLHPYDGFFASVQFKPQKENTDGKLYRGDGMYVNYKGIERIYVS